MKTGSVKQFLTWPSSLF